MELHSVRVVLLYMVSVPSKVCRATVDCRETVRSVQYLYSVLVQLAQKINVLCVYTRAFFPSSFFFLFFLFSLFFLPFLFGAGLSSSAAADPDSMFPSTLSLSHSPIRLSVDVITHVTPLRLRYRFPWVVHHSQELAAAAAAPPDHQPRQLLPGACRRRRRRRRRQAQARHRSRSRTTSSTCRDIVSSAPSSAGVGTEAVLPHR